jgi:hypothetical protein
MADTPIEAARAIDHEEAPMIKDVFRGNPQKYRT